MASYSLIHLDWSVCVCVCGLGPAGLIVKLFGILQRKEMHTVNMEQFFFLVLFRSSYWLFFWWENNEFTLQERWKNL